MKALGLRSALALAALSAVSGWLLRGLGSNTDAPTAAAAPILSAALVNTSAGASVDAQALESMLQRVVRQELQTQLPLALASATAAALARTPQLERAARPGGDSAVRPPMARAPLEVQEQARLAQITAYAAQIVQSGHLGNEQAVQLRQLMAEGPLIESNDALRQLMVAINTGKVRVETDGPPF